MRLDKQMLAYVRIWIMHRGCLFPADDASAPATKAVASTGLLRLQPALSIRSVTKRVLNDAD